VRTKIWFKTLCQQEDIISSPPEFHEHNWVESIFGEKTELPEKHLLDVINQLKSGAVQITQPKPLALAKAS
jgi:hypothetical protein